MSFTSSHNFCNIFLLVVNFIIFFHQYIKANNKPGFRSDSKNIKYYKTLVFQIFLKHMAGWLFSSVKFSLFLRIEEKYEKQQIVTFMI